MLRQSLVLLLVALEVLLGATLHATIDVVYVSIVVTIVALQHEELLAMGDHLRVDGIEGTPAEREIIDGIKEVGLTHPIMADKTVDLGRQLQVATLDVFIVDDGNIL